MKKYQSVRKKGGVVEAGNAAKERGKNSKQEGIASERRNGAQAHWVWDMAFFPPPLVVALLFLAPYPAHAWGIDGQFIICSIAQTMFNPTTLDAVQNLLPEYAGGDLSSLCSWADDVKFHYRWSSPLHYIDTPDSLCNYNYNRDCHNSAGVKNMCAAGAINNYTTQLTAYNSSETRYNLTEALLFLAHIAGDIHQPLHVGFTTDKGGNTIMLYWYNLKENLHHVWDDEIINTALTSYYNSDIQGFIDDISQNITSNDVSVWGSCDAGGIVCPNIYAIESIDAACTWAYKDATSGSSLGDDYFNTRLPIVKKRLAQGGVRLAAILNRIF